MGGRILCYGFGFFFFIYDVCVFGGQGERDGGGGYLCVRVGGKVTWIFLIIGVSYKNQKEGSNKPQQQQQQHSKRVVWLAGS